MTSLLAEGWYIDPFGLHDARWLSAGTPTKLVRDGSCESYDPAPRVTSPLSLVPFEVTTSARNGEDMLRSDSPVRSSRDAMSRAAASVLLRSHG